MPVGQILVIFGASGDLARRKLLPALWSLHTQGLLPEGFAVLGVGRSPLQDEVFRDQIRASLPTDPGVAVFLAKLHWLSIDTGLQTEYPKVSARVQSLGHELGIPGNCIFYLSTPPDLYPVIAQGLASCGLANEQNGFRRLVVEKPFGRNRLLAQQLNAVLHADWKESQIYRIDHYLGKETVQNLLVFRFANEIFDSLWNHRYVDYVEITAAESLGVENRAGYFENSGSIRDMVQNHLLQVLAMVAIDPPVSFDADCVRQETLKIFRSLRPFDEQALKNDVVYGQYVASRIRGQELRAYREEPGVAPLSRTETFAAMRIFVDNHRWFQVPFYLRTGKRLPTRVSEVVVHFKQTPHPAFGIQGGHGGERNKLVLRIQPDEGILLQFGLKQPGSGFHVKNVDMDFHYSELADTRVPESYERLLLDCMLGDATLYALGEAVETCWGFIDPIVAWRESGESTVHGYPAGTWGPLQADALMQRDGHMWRYPCKNLTGDGGYCEL